jgi:hypothetical protein
VPTFTTTTLSGETWSSAALAGDHPTLMVFVKDHCRGCAEFLVAMADPVAAGLVDLERLIMVVDPEDRTIFETSPDHEGVEVMLVGTEARRALRVPGAPFFSLINEAGTEVLSEGVAFGVAQVRDHCRRGLAGFDDSVPRLSGEG